MCRGEEGGAVGARARARVCAAVRSRALPPPTHISVSIFRVCFDTDTDNDNDSVCVRLMARCSRKKTKKNDVTFNAGDAAMAMDVRFDGDGSQRIGPSEGVQGAPMARSHADFCDAGMCSIGCMVMCRNTEMFSRCPWIEKGSSRAHKVRIFTFGGPGKGVERCSDESCRPHSNRNARRKCSAGYGRGCRAVSPEGTASSCSARRSPRVEFVDA